MDSDVNSQEERRLHPMTILQRVAVALPAMFLLLLPVLRSSDGVAWFNLVIAGLYGVLVFPWSIIRYYRFRYRISAKEIAIRSGVFNVRQRNIPVDRIQNVEVEQGILQRMTRTAKVSIFTAGSTAAEGVLDVVSLSEAHAVRESIRRFQAEAGVAEGAAAAAGADGAPAVGADGAPAVGAYGVPAVGADGVRAARAHAARYSTPGTPSNGAITSDTPVTGAETPEAVAGPAFGPGPLPGKGAVRSAGHTQPAAPLFEMDLRQVILSGVFRFSLLYIALFFSAVQYIEPNPEAMLDWLIGSRFEGVAEVASESPVIAFLGTILTAVLFAWLSGIAVNLNRYYGFSLTAEGDKLHHKQGLLSRHTGTIPLRKVQAFIIRTNPLMRRFGWYRLEVQTMGFDVKERGHKVAVPFGRMEDVLRTANRIQKGLPNPDPLGVRQPDLQPVSKLTIRRAFVRYSVVIMVLAGGLWYLWTPGAWLLTLLPLALVAAILRYRHMGWGEDEKWLYIRRGVIRQHTWLLPVERTQVLLRSASFFQRRLGLASLSIDSAGASVTRPAEAVDLPQDVARDVIDRAYARFKTIHGGG